MGVPQIVLFPMQNHLILEESRCFFWRMSIYRPEAGTTGRHARARACALRIKNTESYVKYAQFVPAGFGGNYHQLVRSERARRRSKSPTVRISRPSFFEKDARVGQHRADV